MDNKVRDTRAGLLNALHFLSKAEVAAFNFSDGLKLKQARQREKFMWMQVYEAAREFIAAYEEGENARKD